MSRRKGSTGISPRLQERAAIAIEHGAERRGSVLLILVKDVFFLFKLACLPRMGRLARPPIDGQRRPRVPTRVLLEALRLVSCLGDVPWLGLSPSVQGRDGMLR